MRCSAALAFLVATATMAAEPFVYQGTLDNNGEPVTGVYDFSVVYYAAPTGGTRPTPVIVQDVQVTDGLFVIELPAPSIEGSRYLEFGVRDGASTGVFTTLSPRTFVAAAPIASEAIKANWELDENGKLIYGDGDDAVLINRNIALPNEYFGFGTNTTGFAGMYARTGSAGKPFYGYSAGGDADAFHFFDGSANLFRLNIAQLNVATIDPQGNLDLEGQIEADDFEFTAPKEIAVDVPMVGFRPSNTYLTFIPYVAGGQPTNGAYMLQSGSMETMIAPVQLPHGARIKELRAHITDTDPDRRLTVYLDEVYPQGNSYTVASATYFAGATSSLFEIVETPELEHFVNNFVGSYRIRVATNFDGWSGSESVSIRKVTVVVEKLTAD